jgi:hypothetical protein
MTNGKYRYRHLAKECHRLANTLPVGASGRTSLLEMAEVWERLAREVAPTSQQQQQAQPEHEKTRTVGPPDARRSMPIRALLDVDGAAFDPEDIKAITSAHEMVLNRLKIEDRKSAMAFLAAKTMIQIAKDGERDPQRLSERVIRVLQKAQPGKA